MFACLVYAAVVALAAPRVTGAAAERVEEGSPAGSLASSWDDEALGYDSVTAWLKALTSSPECAAVTRLTSLGRSVEGRDVWGVEVSDRPGSDEAEPGFRFVAGMHGDEGVGVDLSLRLLRSLCEERNGEVVAGAHTWVVPMANPDGLEARSRGNARGVDLNRDFPDPVHDDPGKGEGTVGREPETEALMKLILEERVHAGASLHGGALAVSIPWDGSVEGEREEARSPDDAGFRWLGSNYAGACGLPMAAGTVDSATGYAFEGGMTNGAEWYPVYGGMQDYGYVHGGSLEVTVELGDDKWPHEDGAFSRAWEVHRPSLWALLRAGTLGPGVTGTVVDVKTGKAVTTAHVRVDGVDSPPAVERVGSVFGDFHRVLAPREDAYVVWAEAPEYEMSEAVAVTVSGEDGQERPRIEFKLRRVSRNRHLGRFVLDDHAYVRPDVLAALRRRRATPVLRGWVYGALLGVVPVAAVVLALSTILRPGLRRRGRDV